MDGYQGYPSEFDPPPEETPPVGDVAAMIGTDERRMHVRAYNYWVSLLDGRDYPSIEDLEPGDVVLVKASRSAGLERVAAALLADGAGGSPPVVQS